MAERVQAQVRVHGRVQGVYFRASTAEEASARHLAGWVRNTDDGVEAVFEGTRSSVERMIAWCHQGPPRAHVERVDVAWAEPEGLESFRIRY